MALRDLVKDVHTQAEESPFAQLLMSGNITKQQYKHYLDTGNMAALLP